MQSKILAGDSFSYSWSLPSKYSDWTPNLKLSGPSSIDIPWSEPDSAFKATAAMSALWASGFYRWAIYVTSGSERSTLESGTVNIELVPDLNTDADPRNKYQRVVDAIDAVMEGRATKDQSAYTISGRQLTRIPIPELLQLRGYYSNLARIESTKMNGKRPMTSFNYQLSAT